MAKKGFDGFAAAMEIAQKISQAVPESLGELPKDFSDKIKEIVNASLKKMDIVTREDFEKAELRIAKLEELLADKTETKGEAESSSKP